MGAMSAPRRSTTSMGVARSGADGNHGRSNTSALSTGPKDRLDEAT